MRRFCARRIVIPGNRRGADDFSAQLHGTSRVTAVRKDRHTKAGRGVQPAANKGRHSAAVGAGAEKLRARLKWDGRGPPGRVARCSRSRMERFASSLWGLRPFARTNFPLDRQMGQAKSRMPQGSAHFASPDEEPRSRAPEMTAAGLSGPRGAGPWHQHFGTVSGLRTRRLASVTNGVEITRAAPHGSIRCGCRPCPGRGDRRAYDCGRNAKPR